MRNTRGHYDRRRFLSTVSGLSAFALIDNFSCLAPIAHASVNSKIITKPIPSTNEQIPVIGMGTWITFNVGEDQKLREHRIQILKEFFRHGGGMIDCSPMYGTSADVLGYGLSQLDKTPGLFTASKVWTSSTSNGIEQIQQQQQRWKFNRFDLLQIHNLRNWQGHLETLKQYKADGKIRYLGVTTSHGRRHEELEQVMLSEELDFVQLTYNIIDRETENRLLPIARERGIAVIANRPYKQKELFHMFGNNKIPAWASDEADANNWAEFFLKFVVSHPAVTCAIPATSQIPHMTENMNAAYGRLPDQKARKRMLEYVSSL